MLQLHAKGETPTAIVMWMGTLIAVIIIMFWIARTMRPVNADLDRMNSDLQLLQFRVSDACTSYLFNQSMNPVTETGTLQINGNRACMNVSGLSACKPLVCDTRWQGTFDLESVVDVRVMRTAAGISFEAVT